MCFFFFFKKKEGTHARATYKKKKGGKTFSPPSSDRETDKKKFFFSPCTYVNSRGEELDVAGTNALLVFPLSGDNVLVGRKLDVGLAGETTIGGAHNVDAIPLNLESLEKLGNLTLANRERDSAHLQHTDGGSRRRCTTTRCVAKNKNKNTVFRLFRRTLIKINIFIHVLGTTDG